MAYTGDISGRERAAAALTAFAVALAVGAGLITGLDLHVVRAVQQAISAVAISVPPAQPKPPEPSPAPDDTASGAAAAANRHAKAAQTVAPKPKRPPPHPPLITAAPRAGAGSDASAGATPDLGPGSGAGGHGDGTGAGGSGTGTGGGTRPVWLSGTIRDRDYPKSASRARTGGDVEVRFTIQPTGRVTGCRVSRSSGDAALDATTCRLIEERFRFKPATDGAGVAIASQYGWRQSWWLEPRR